MLNPAGYAQLRLRGLAFHCLSRQPWRTRRRNATNLQPRLRNPCCHKAGDYENWDEYAQLPNIVGNWLTTTNPHLSQNQLAVLPPPRL
jgi:hypothetical protein